MTKIYTRKGDQGQTWIAGQSNVPKHDLRVEICGTLDELNCAIGLAASFDLPAVIAGHFDLLQNQLFQVGAQLATAQGAGGWTPAAVERLETWIDLLQQQLAELRNFVLPGGCSAAAATHLARAICRRCERLLVRGTGEGTVADPGIVAYLNRLSDYLFVAARFINRQARVEERIWRAES